MIGKITRNTVLVAACDYVSVYVIMCAWPCPQIVRPILYS